MCYATETWPDNKAVAKAMQTTHHALEKCFLKTSLRQQRQQGIRSSELREKSQLADPLQYMKKSQYRWAGHLLRRKDPVSQNGSQETIRDHWDDRQQDGQTHFQSLSENVVSLTGCKLTEIKRSGRVVVPAEKISS
ncbi:unnamed protein product [Nippostrongylus brasiliensis]|uniref:Uncharacterized protein n=1 Tax=Nippostrongylus brasiliensis TaxID=27835 RepID=A0A0N4Y2W7_NIPBR|nr:unnamed protein product [Nippostrongylus brasiliensis]